MSDACGSALARKLRPVSRLSVSSFLHPADKAAGCADTCIYLATVVLWLARSSETHAAAQRLQMVRLRRNQEYERLAGSFTDGDPRRRRAGVCAGRVAPLHAAWTLFFALAVLSRRRSIPSISPRPLVSIARSASWTVPVPQLRRNISAAPNHDRSRFHHRQISCRSLRALCQRSTLVSMRQPII